ncbi:MAG: hypothetical protein ABI760_00930 [Ferruginibacter sp.]
MTKLKPSNITYSGKMGDRVFVNSKTWGPHTRAAPKKECRKDDPVLKLQNSRTGFIDGLASEINKTIKIYGGRLMYTGFYGKLITLFRQEPLNNRYLMLLLMKGMEINPDYPLGKLGAASVAVKKLKDEITVNLQVLAHPDSGKHNANSYFCELTLLSWDKSKKAATHSMQKSKLVYLNYGRPEFIFRFLNQKNTTHWLLCLRKRLCKDDNLIGVFVTDGMQIVEVGTFNKKEQAIVDQRRAAKEAERAVRKVKKEDINEGGVAATRFL